MSKPKKYYRVEHEGALKRAYGNYGTKKRTFAIKGYALNAVEDLYRHGATKVRLYETTCDWKEVEI